MFEFFSFFKNRTAIFLFPFLLISSVLSQETIDWQGLEALESELQKDLFKINVPPALWIMHSIESDNNNILDVAIIGGGMAGMTVAFALMKEGISNIKIFDENLQNQEGPWIKYARMNVLRSGKRYMGPALDVPSLTFWSWFEACFGKENWENLRTSSTKIWHDYLCWYRRVLKLPIENEMTLLKINPVNDILELIFDNNGHSIIVYARKVVLATGREGSGGYEIPSYLTKISKNFYAHTGEIIDSTFFVNKRIAIIGGGSSAFDAAAVALENCAESVDMLVRRSAIAQVNKFGQFSFPGFENGFYVLSDEMKCTFFAEAYKYGIDLSKFAVERVKEFKNFCIHYNIHIQDVIEKSDTIILQTNQKKIMADYIIVAAGNKIDLSLRHELDVIKDSILLWKNHVPQEILQHVPMLGFFPYLGPHFEFMETISGTASFLKNIYCFNYGSTLSHGLLSGGIPGISSGATRLAKGIAADFFLSEQILYFEKIKNWQTPGFNVNDYHFFKECDFLCDV